MFQRQAEREVLVLPEDICSVDRSEARNINPGEEVVQFLVQATAFGLSRGEARLLGGLFVGGWSAGELGAQEGVTARMIRYRRAEAIRKLAAFGLTLPGKPLSRVHGSAGFQK